MHVYQLVFKRKTKNISIPRQSTILHPLWGPTLSKWLIRPDACSRSHLTQLPSVVSLAHITTTWKSVGRTACRSVYHVTHWNCTRVLGVSEVHGSHAACPVTGAERVPVRTPRPGQTHIASPPPPQQQRHLRDSLTYTQVALFSRPGPRSFTISMKWAPLILEGSSSSRRIRWPVAPVLAQRDYVGHTLLWLIKNSEWRDLLHSLQRILTKWS